MKYAGRLEDIVIGDTESVTRVVRHEDLRKFAEAIDSHHPLHMDEAWARANTQFDGGIVHGVMTAALVSRPIVNFLKRHQIETVTIYVASKFIAPVRVGDSITHQLTVAKIDTEKRRIIFSTRATNQAEVLVMVGEAHEQLI